MSLGVQSVPVPSLRGRGYRLRAPLLLGAAVGALSMRVWAVDPNVPGHYPVCPTYALAGIYCPGCGVLRATHALLHGDLAASFGFNLLLPPIAVLSALLFVGWVRARWRGEQLRWTPAPWVAWALLVGVSAFTLARNLPAFAVLAP